jgi:glycosyltransferase involved in cell wall biosynthesis
MPNPVKIEAIRHPGDLHPRTDCWKGSGPRLLAVGRLSPEKGFDLLFHALALAGQGSEEDHLKSLVRRLGLESAVCFLGAIGNPAAFFPAADLFVLSSRYEGLPNALLEAAASGLPLVSTPASGGIIDLLREKPGCWLSDEISASALASALLQALDVLQPGQRFPHAFIEDFRMETALEKWNKLFATILEPGQ